ncbi:hypothetical protein ABPG75_007349 [Micractinium tetrahymenae]
MPFCVAQEPVFYTHTLCPYAERVFVALLEKRVPFHLVHVDLAHKPAWYRGLNLRGLVPAVQHQGQVHLESADIIRWVDSAFEGPPLVPSEAAARRDMEELLRGPCSKVVSAGLDLMAGKTGRYWGIGGGQSAAQRSAMDAALQGLAGSLSKHGGPFLLGAAPCLADIAVYPFAKRFAVAAPLTGTTAADPGLLLQAFRKHMSLDFFDYDSFNAFQLHPQNRHLLEL